MSIIKQEWALSTWQNRKFATYFPVSTPINGRIIDAFGRTVSSELFGSPTPRRAVKMDEGDVTSYVMYDDDTAGPVPIIKITMEAE